MTAGRETMAELRYDTPAADWNAALPLGNGFMGAMCFGGTVQDRFSLNDDSLWSGGYLDRINPDARDNLDKVRRLLREERFTEAEEVTEETLLALPEGERAYELLCELTVQVRTPEHHRFISPHQALWFERRNMLGYEPAEGVSEYRRSLCTDDGICRVSYILDGIPFRRESFISYPARVMAVRLEGGEWRAFLRRAGRNGPQRRLDGRTVSLEGQTANGGPRYCCVMRAAGADIACAGDMLKGSGSAVLFIASASSLREGEDYFAQALARLDRAEAAGWDGLLREHLADFRPLMDACRLELERDPELQKYAMRQGLKQEEIESVQKLAAPRERTGSLVDIEDEQIMKK